MSLSDEQTRLVQALCEPERQPHPVEHMETHISHILLAGEFAYKIKKPLDLGFLDFTSLEKRHFYCEEELRLNRRLAPQLYLAVIPIHGSSEAPRLGTEQPGPIIEYAIKMNRFPQESLFDQMAQRGALHAEHIDALAGVVADFHAKVARTDTVSPWGGAAGIEAPMRQNFSQIRALLNDPAEQEALDRLEEWSCREHARLANIFAARQRDGWVRECHGDLHLGNVVWLAGAAQPFDGIEFNANLRWIDVVSEVAFMVMDLHAHDCASLAQRFLNTWLEHSGDFGGLALLNYYVVYRAMVRAKIARLRAAQMNTAAIDEPARQQALAEYARYVALAQRFSQSHQRTLIIMHGLSGSGKSVLAEALCETLGAVRIRSDVERKRMQGLAPLARSGSAQGGGIYGKQTTAETYAELARLARLILDAGWPAVGDATFLRREQRAGLRAVAEKCGTPLLIVTCSAEHGQLRERIARRQAQQKDVSEADLAVLENQLDALEPLDEPALAEELRITIDTARQSNVEAVTRIAAALAEK